MTKLPRLEVELSNIDIRTVKSWMLAHFMPRGPARDYTILKDDGNMEGRLSGLHPDPTHTQDERLFYLGMLTGWYGAVGWDVITKRADGEELVHSNRLAIRIFLEQTHAYQRVVSIHVDCEEPILITQIHQLAEALSAEWPTLKQALQQYRRRLLRFKTRHSDVAGQSIAESQPIGAVNAETIKRAALILGLKKEKHLIVLTMAVERQPTSSILKKSGFDSSSAIDNLISDWRRRLSAAGMNIIPSRKENSGAWTRA